MVEAFEELIKQRRLYDREYSRYDKYKLENWQIAYIKRIFEFLKLDHKDIFLDIGSGCTGYTVIEGAKRNVKAIGIDLSLEGMKLAKKFSKSVLKEGNSFCEFIACSATHLPFQEGSVSKVASVAVLEHIPSDDLAIEEIARITRPNSLVFLAVPNAYRRIPPHFVLPYLLHDRRVGHLRHYKAEELLKKFNQVKFDLVELSYSANIPKIIQYLISVIFRKFSRTDSKVWWKLEELDRKMKRLPTGLNIFFCVKKTNK